ncbi:magnesium transporter MgtE N-terminal domain-containing protein [Tersicoccus phoenicis]|uniref:magnesium transporter MgtE N-terminal domain-containing protein n=1 Tax=Tersicoccus phoenicis TaxID=554083 RepID=UPI0009FE1151|nr:CBS domain-containing protein [Tersicoccus phoenicis]
MTNSPSLVFVARLLGMDVFEPLGERLGRLRDVVVVHRSATRPPQVVGIIVEVLAKKRVFVAMTRVTSIDNGQILITGLVNFRRFQQRGAEIRIAAELFDRKVTLTDGSGIATIEDISIERQRNGDWYCSQMFVRRGHSTSRLRSLRRGAALTIDWSDAYFEDQAEPQGAVQFLAAHEDLKDADLADMMHEMNDKRMLEIAAELQDDRLADVLQELPDDDQVQILSALETDRAANVLNEMEPDDAADLLSDLPEEQKEELLQLMEPDDAEDVRRLLEYEEGTAGSLMTPIPVILPPEATVAEALAHVRREDISPALASAVFVARPPLETPTGRFLGVVHIQQLLRFPPPEALGNLVDRNLEPVTDHTSIVDVSRTLASYNLNSLPVVNDDGRLVGAVTVDDVLDALLPQDWRSHDDTPAASRNPGTPTGTPLVRGAGKAGSTRIGGRSG